jgi:phospho-N-acetylmuramoyl-pentapeptide-transferase
VLIAGTASLLICIFLSPRFIDFIRAREFGQHIREEGPEGHHTKAGTPTMGGLIIFAAVSIPFLILTDWSWQAMGVFGTAIACALIGFADDYTKIIRRRSLGLRARTKLLATIAISIGLWLAATEGAGLQETVRLRVIDAQIDLAWAGGILYLVFVYLVVAGTTSGVNLTDGLDGLAAGTGIIALLTYTAINVIAFIRERGGTDLDLAILGGALIGGAIGFLWYNAFPAEVFMGDTGSMAIGGALAGFAVMTKTETLLPLIGGIFLINALSVIIQVFTFKYLGRRVFLMAPIHHHFEMKAWSETKIMVRFWILTAILCGSAFALYYRYYISFRA